MPSAPVNFSVPSRLTSLGFRLIGDPKRNVLGSTNSNCRLLSAPDLS